MLTELIEAARRGIRVRIIVDQLHEGPGAKRLALLVLAHRNLEVRLYNPFGQEAESSLADKLSGLFFNFAVLNHRMHNKLMVVDGQVAITGGRNIENKYYDYDPHFNFIDRDVLIVGPVVNDMQAVFETYWQDPIVVAGERLNDVHAELERIDYTLPEGRLELPQSLQFAPLIKQAVNPTYVNTEFIDTAFRIASVRYSADRPGKPFIKDEDTDDNISENIQLAVAGASTRITVQTPYFILSGTAVDRLKALRELNPSIEYSVITNSLASTDQYYVYALSYKRKKRNIDKLGFRIFELKPFPRDTHQFMPRYDTLLLDGPPTPAFEPVDFKEETPGPAFAPVPVAGEKPRLSIHAKSMVVDGRIAIVGSHNFDPRSNTINTESALIVVDDTFAAALEKNILLAAKPGNSWVAARRETVPLIGHMGRFFASISRALPVFDLWPFRYTSNFELKAGMVPVLPTHPDFYDHYEDVGQFPGTSVGDDQLKTYLVSGFGSLAEPLM
jgi:phosphatidylserine/phosphatidylglycerophosphate/cardiolipin synthase-like enzyme